MEPFAWFIVAVAVVVVGGVMLVRTADRRTLARLNYDPPPVVGPKPPGMEIMHRKPERVEVFRYDGTQAAATALVEWMGGAGRFSRVTQTMQMDGRFMLEVSTDGLPLANRRAVLGTMRVLPGEYVVLCFTGFFSSYSEDFLRTLYATPEKYAKLLAKEADHA